MNSDHKTYWKRCFVISNLHSTTKLLLDRSKRFETNDKIVLLSAALIIMTKRNNLISWHPHTSSNMITRSLMDSHGPTCLLALRWRLLSCRRRIHCKALCCKALPRLVVHLNGMTKKWTGSLMQKRGHHDVLYFESFAGNGGIGGKGV